MKKIWLLCLMCSLSMSAFSGNEFWKWQADHKQSIINGEIKISQDNAQYIENLKSTWTEIELTSKPFTPIAFEANLPSKKIKPRKIYHAAHKTNLDVLPIEILDTKHILNERIAFQFYDHNLKIKDSAHWGSDILVLNESDVALLWEHFSKQPVDPLLTQFKMLKETLHLNDWDYALMLFHYSKIWQTSLNAQLLQTQYLLIQSGYKVKVGLDGNNVVLLMNTRHKILNNSYMTDDQKNRWYVMDFEDKNTILNKIKWMSKKHKQSKEIFNLRMNPDLNLGGIWKNKLVTYQINDEQFDIYLPFNMTIIKHYQTYPILPLSDYVNNDMHNMVSDSIITQIKSKIDIKNEQATLNFLLGLSQSIMSVNQVANQGAPILFLQAIDSESMSTYERVLLFKNLTNKVLGNYMMVVEYNNHLSVGVKLTTEHKLKTFHVNLGDYVFADPSYVNAKLGEKMPIEQSVFVSWHPLF